MGSAGVGLGDFAVFGGIEAVAAKDLEFGQDVGVQVDMEEAGEEVRVLLNEVKMNPCLSETWSLPSSQTSWPVSMYSGKSPG